MGHVDGVGMMVMIVMMMMMMMMMMMIVMMMMMMITMMMMWRRRKRKRIAVMMMMMMMHVRRIYFMNHVDTQGILSLSSVYISTQSPDYPVGRYRLEALSVIACAFIMSMASIEGTA